MEGKVIQCVVGNTGNITYGPFKDELRDPDYHWYDLSHNMTQETLRKWVEALRSGAYEQIPDYLYGEGERDVEVNLPEEDWVEWGESTMTDTEGYYGYCCLGVLGSVCGAHDCSLDGRGFLDGNLLELTGMLPGDSPPSAATAPRDYDGNYISEGHKDNPTPLQALLAEMNDAEWTFEQIADWIEEHLFDTPPSNQTSLFA